MITIAKVRLVIRISRPRGRGTTKGQSIGKERVHSQGEEKNDTLGKLKGGVGGASVYICNS